VPWVLCTLLETPKRNSPMPKSENADVLATNVHNNGHRHFGCRRNECATAYAPSIVSRWRMLRKLSNGFSDMAVEIKPMTTKAIIGHSIPSFDPSPTLPLSLSAFLHLTISTATHNVSSARLKCAPAIEHVTKIANAKSAKACTRLNIELEVQPVASGKFVVEIFSSSEAGNWDAEDVVFIVRQYNNSLPRFQN